MRGWKRARNAAREPSFPFSFLLLFALRLPLIRQAEGHAFTSMELFSRARPLTGVIGLFFNNKSIVRLLVIEKATLNMERLHASLTATGLPCMDLLPVAASQGRNTPSEMICSSIPPVANKLWVPDRAPQWRRVGDKYEVTFSNRDGTVDERLRGQMTYILNKREVMTLIEGCKRHQNKSYLLIPRNGPELFLEIDGTAIREIDPDLYASVPEKTKSRNDSDSARRRLVNESNVDPAFRLGAQVKTKDRMLCSSIPPDAKDLWVPDIAPRWRRKKDGRFEVNFSNRDGTVDMRLHGQATYTLNKLEVMTLSEGCARHRGINYLAVPRGKPLLFVEIEGEPMREVAPEFYPFQRQEELQGESSRGSYTSGTAARSAGTADENRGKVENTFSMVGTPSSLSRSHMNIRVSGDDQSSMYRFSPQDAERRLRSLLDGKTGSISDRRGDSRSGSALSDRADLVETTRNIQPGDNSARPRSTNQKRSQNPAGTHYSESRTMLPQRPVQSQWPGGEAVSDSAMSPSTIMQSGQSTQSPSDSKGKERATPALARLVTSTSMRASGPVSGGPVSGAPLSSRPLSQTIPPTPANLIDWSAIRARATENLVNWAKIVTSPDARTEVLDNIGRGSHHSSIPDGSDWAKVIPIENITEENRITAAINALQLPFQTAVGKLDWEGIDQFVAIVNDFDEKRQQLSTVMSQSETQEGDASQLQEEARTALVQAYKEFLPWAEWIGTLNLKEFGLELDDLDELEAQELKDEAMTDQVSNFVIAVNQVYSVMLEQRGRGPRGSVFAPTARTSALRNTPSDISDKGPNDEVIEGTPPDVALRGLSPSASESQSRDGERVVSNSDAQANTPPAGSQSVDEGDNPNAQGEAPATLQVRSDSHPVMSNRGEGSYISTQSRLTQTTSYLSHPGEPMGEAM